eukprot:CAMPEP_0116899118 /NCGR_PEP_ID=MMETSP0467-20121206/7744_1 /TAXON_ID=283647 /ORGANISM="Mesodinium pulex, Strain SPMC105" /LENGTH=109 /DNA_ID=CAMNT_0004571733 /DNA_START=722 /DNA_END=1052 /DNA_ORIENTATION=+
MSPAVEVVADVFCDVQGRGVLLPQQNGEGYSQQREQFQVLDAGHFHQTELLVGHDDIGDDHALDDQHDEQARHHDPLVGALLTGLSDGPRYLGLPFVLYVVNYCLVTGA